jgi:hypothetical protein
MVVRTVRFNPWLNPSWCSWGYGHNHGKKYVSRDVYRFPYKSHNIPTIQLIQWGTVDIHSSISWMSRRGVYNGIYCLFIYIFIPLYINTIIIYHLFIPLLSIIYMINTILSTPWIFIVYKMAIDLHLFIQWNCSCQIVVWQTWAACWSIASCANPRGLWRFFWSDSGWTNGSLMGH